MTCAIALSVQHQFSPWSYSPSKWRAPTYLSLGKKSSWEEKCKFVTIYLNFCASQNDCNEGKVAKGAQCFSIFLVCYQASQYIYISWAINIYLSQSLLWHLLCRRTRGFAGEQRYSGTDKVTEKEDAGKAGDVVVRKGKPSNSWHNSTWNHVLLVLLLVHILNKFSLVLAWDCHINSCIKKWKNKNLWLRWNKRNQDIWILIQILSLSALGKICTIFWRHWAT